LKVCFCGLGSIGKRHLRNLIRVAPEFHMPLTIHALRKTGRVLEESISGLITKQITDESGLDRDYDIAFITNPTGMHVETMRTMADRTQHMFIEKPVSDGRDGAGNLDVRQGGVQYVAGPLRYSPVIQRLREMIGRRRVYSVRAICSSYLPDWRPGLDYRQTYSAKKELGGGVDIDLIHEWDYIVDLFGFPEQVHRICGKYSDLAIDSPDIAIYIAEYENMAAELHLDYFGREVRREIELFTADGTIAGDLIRNTVTYTGERIHFAEDDNDMYMREMRFFLGRIQEGRAFNNIRHCLAVLDIALGRESV